MRIKVLYPRNLRMSEGKVAAQVAHAVKNLGDTPVDCSIVVLKASTTKMISMEEVLMNSDFRYYLQKDLGLTEVPAGTPTALAWIEKI